MANQVYATGKQLLETNQYLKLSANDVTFLYSSYEYKTKLIELIENAKTRIYFCLLYWQHDEVGQELIDILYKAKQNKPELDIQILVDYHRANRNLLGAKDPGLTNAQWYQSLQLKYNLPLDNTIKIWGVPVNTKEVAGVLHVKGIIIDDNVVYSGASVNNVYLGTIEHYRYDRYQMIFQPELANVMCEFLDTNIIQHPATVRLDIPEQCSFVKSEVKNFREKFGLSTYQYASANMASIGELGIMPIFGLHNKQLNLLNENILALLNTAEEKIVICTPYFNLPKTITKALKQALKRGVNVEIIVGDKTANDFYVPPTEPYHISSALPYLYEDNLRHFMRKLSLFILKQQLSVRVWKHLDNTFHLKGIWVDNRYYLLTGHNLNPRAYNRDAENGLLIHDPQHQLLDQTDKELTCIREHTTIVTFWDTLDSIKTYPKKVRKILKRLKQIKVDSIVKSIL